MSAGDVTVQGVRMTESAAQAVEWAGMIVANDVHALRAGLITEAELLRSCVDGADYHEAWSEYVAAVVAAADNNGVSP